VSFVRRGVAFEEGGVSFVSRDVGSMTATPPLLTCCLIPRMKSTLCMYILQSKVQSYLFAHWSNKANMYE
jgi:hypothetical protein